jgi:hypothetical protein
MKVKLIVVERAAGRLNGWAAEKSAAGLLGTFRSFRARSSDARNLQKNLAAKEQTARFF